MRTELQTQETGLQITEVQRIMGDAPVVLQENKTRVQKAVEFAKNLIKNSEEVGMNDALDAQMSNYIDKAKKTVTAINERRKPFTQMVDAIKKEFTSQESALKSVIEEVQGIRNAYVTLKMEEQRKREEAARLKLAKEQELIDIRKQAEIQLATNFNEHTREAKQLLLDKFNGATLGNIDEIMLDLAEFNKDLTVDIYKTFRPKISSRYYTEEEIKPVIAQIMNLNYKVDKDTYAKEISAYVADLRSKKASKINELRELAKASAAERERLEEAKRLREQAEADRIAKEAEEARQKAEAEAAVVAAGANAAATVDAAVVTSVKPDVKEGYEIELKNVAANLLLVQMWFENEGKNLSQDKINKVTFDRIRKFCELHAIKTGEMIDSPFVEYIPIYKAK
ncbi:MAG: hypothetical protein LBC68_08265 [Prevotellaceae bacterium]|jgi:hypothetical protein|nr:hypothetical protein [Prevotellaceae bacterium]